MDNIAQLFDKVNAEIDEDIYASRAESFLDEMGRTYNESMTRAELEEADELNETRALQEEEHEK